MISNDLLTSYFASRTGATAALASSATARPKTPTAPWVAGSTAPQADALVKSVLAGRRFIDPGAVQLDVKGANEDYRKLFGLFQGLNALNALAERADTKGVGRVELATLSKRFDAGMKEVNAYISTLKLEQARLYQGEVLDRARGSVGVKRDKFEYTTGVVHNGEMDAVSAALSGDVRFDIQVYDKVDQVTRTIAIDLAGMASAPRNFGNFINYANAQLEAAGVETRLSREKLPNDARTGAGGVTLPAAVDRWALKIVGDDDETVRFTSGQTSDAVYLAQATGKVPVEDKDPAQIQQLLKFQSGVADAGGGAPEALRAADTGTVDDANWVAGRAFSRTMGPEVAAVRATAAAPDGGVYVLGEVTSATAGQTLQGKRDVALMRYDSAGQLLFTRTLGAADEASGFALAVGADGQVAIAGKVTGALAGTGALVGSAGVVAADDSLDAKVSDSFVTLFDAEGQEVWTRRRGAVAEDEARAVAIGADGTVFVGGRTQSSISGAGGVGGWDGYVQTFAGADGALRAVQQFGTSETDGVSALAVDGSSLVVAGEENGRAVLRRFGVDGTTGALSAEGTRDLGALNGGAVAGVAFDGGRVVVAGTTYAALSGGTVTQAYGGGRDGFVTSLSGDLTADAGDRTTYVGGAGEDSVTALAVKGGQVYVAGASTGALGSTTPVGTSDGFIMRLNPATGAVGETIRFAGKDGVAAPTSIAVAGGAASVLDRLGLPQGDIDYSDSKLVTAATSARAGDQFFVRTREGSRGVAVTIAADDTLKTLAVKVNRALGFAGKAEVVRDGDYDRLQIKPLNERTLVEVMPGTGSKDLLQSLGLTEGVVRSAVTSSTAPKVGVDSQRAPYGLGLNRNLNLSEDLEIKHAVAELQTAMVAIRKLYRDLKGEAEPAPPKATGEASAYMKGQIANYQAALERLSA